MRTAYAKVNDNNEQATRCFSMHGLDVPTPTPAVPQVLEHSLDGLVSRHEGTAIVNDVRGEINALVSQLYGNRDNGGGSKATNRGRAGDRKSAKREVRKAAGRCRNIVLSLPMLPGEVPLQMCILCLFFF